MSSLAPSIIEMNNAAYMTAIANLKARIAEFEAERDQLRAEVERLRKPLTNEQVIAIKRATKAADPTQQWGDTLAFARAIEAAKEAK